MDGNTNPLADIVPAAKLPEVAPHLCDAHRVNYWLRMRQENGAEKAGALWVRDGIAYASLSKLGAWLTSPSRLLPKRGPRKSGSRK
jgi:hypothetical protein